MFNRKDRRGGIEHLNPHLLRDIGLDPAHFIEGRPTRRLLDMLAPLRRPKR